MLKQTQSQRLVQKILPQLIQKQSLLAIPTLALEQMIRLELEQNPFLEEIEPESSEEQTDIEDINVELTKEEKKTDDDYDWNDFMDTDTEGYKTPYSGSDDNVMNYENLWKSPHSKNDYLLSQLYLSDLTQKEVVIGEAIISSLDEDGYFRDNLDDFINQLELVIESLGEEKTEIVESEVIKVLKVIQTFDPEGIAARNLAECLKIQILNKKLDDKLKSLAIKIIENYFDEFRLKKYEKLKLELNISNDEINEVFDIYQKLNPKPAGSIEDSANSDYIIPDLIVYKENDDYVIELNERNVPSLRINSAYRKLIQEDEKKLDKNTKEFIHNNFERSKWFLQAINSRRETMLKVMNSILKYQKEFFDNLGESLNPLYEKEVAEDIGMDISTVSRTVCGKYVQTVFGIYELRGFFSHSFKKEGGEDVSNTKIKSKLKEIIEKEDSTNPLTDDALVTEMQKYGFKLARRTIAKYRDMMNIPKARMRRKLIN